MKKNTLIAGLAIVLGVSGVSLAQTQQERAKITKDYNLSKTAVLAQEIQSSTKKNFDRALRLAKRFDWPLTIEYKDGGFGELIGVLEDDSPLYYRTYNKGGVSTIHADAVHTGGSAGLDLNGEGMFVGVWDGGLMRLTHELYEGRVEGKNTTSNSAHATHVGGTIIGSAVVNDGDAIGVAPQATAYSYDWSNDFSEMLAEAEDGLLISNHSYGIAATDDFGNPLIPASYFGQYQSSSQYLDNMLYELEYYLPVYAAGNDRSSSNVLNPDGNGYDLLTGEGVSKNNLVVGSIHQINNYTSPNFVRVSSFSNFGPTDDGRVKPDITAKGNSVYSATSSSDDSYGVMSGTSMASPSVSGGLVLVQQYANEIYNNHLRSATLRALVAHTALKAGAEGNPNYRFGWGVMNVEKAVDVITNDGDSSLVKEMKLLDGQEYLISVKASEVEDLIATIGWTDLPGELGGGVNNRTPRLVNDLDLRLSKVDGDTYYPFMLDPVNPEAPATTGDNIRDNIEKIEIINPQGEYSLSISHKGALEEEEQKVSLILSGIENKPLVLETYNNNKSLCSNSTDELSIELLISSENNIEDTVVTIENAPQQVTSSLDTSDIANGIVMLNISGLMGLENDSYSFELKAVNGTDETKLYPTFNITNDIFEPVELLSPENGKDRIRNFTRFEWNPILSDRVVLYTLEIALDEAFETIVDTIEDIDDTEYLYVGVENDEDYFWRVKAVGECGEGEYSEVFSFHTYDLLSVDDFEQNGFVVHPNPATNQVIVNAPSTIKELKVFNVLGQEVMHVTPDSDQVQLDISALSVGSYLLQISDGNATEVKRLIKK